MLDFLYMIENMPKILEAVPRTLAMVSVAMLLGFAGGFMLALFRLYKVPVLSQLTTAYISLLRGIPLLVQMYLIFFGLPKVFRSLNESWGTSILPTEFNAYFIAILIFALYSAAYQAETWYAALNSIEYGQMEGAQSVGMTIPQALLHIIVPQAMVNALPNFGNLFIGLVKGSSLMFSIQIIDIMAVAKIQAGDDYHYLEMYIVVSLIYWIINLFFEWVFLRLEKYFYKYKIA